MRPVELLVDGCRRVLPLLRSSVLSDRWSEPSALGEWSNSGLAGHLARSAFSLERALDVQAGGHDICDAVTYYAASEPKPPDSPIGRRIRELGDHEAAAGPVNLANRFAKSTARIRALSLNAATTVEMFGRVLTIDDCATACLVELVVHADDLAVSIGVESPVLDEQAADLVVLTLVRISRSRHGDMPVIRSLSRSERAPASGISAF